PVPQAPAQESLGWPPRGRAGGGPPDPAFGAVGTRHFGVAAEGRGPPLDDHLARAALPVFEGLPHGVDGRAGHVAAKEAEPIGGGLHREARLENFYQLRLVGETLREAREARILEERGQLHSLREGLPELVLVAEDDDPPVAGGEVLG